MGAKTPTKVPVNTYILGVACETQRAHIECRKTNQSHRKKRPWTWLSSDPTEDCRNSFREVSMNSLRAYGPVIWQSGCFYGPDRSFIVKHTRQLSRCAVAWLTLLLVGSAFADNSK